MAGRAIAATTSVPRGGTLATTSSAAAVGGRGSRAVATGAKGFVAGATVSVTGLAIGATVSTTGFVIGATG